MKGATRFALIAVLCWLGFAHAKAHIYWGPKRTPCEDQPAWTSDNNTWSATGFADTIAVAFVKEVDDVKTVWFAVSTNKGRDWLPSHYQPLFVVDPGEKLDSATAPSLVKLDVKAEALVVAFLSWEHDTNGVITRVKCRGSGNGGYTWSSAADATYDQGGGDNRPGALDPCLASTPTSEGQYQQQFEVVWREPYVYNSVNYDSIGNRCGKFINGQIDFIRNYPVPVNVDEENPDPHGRAPSIYVPNTIPTFPGCAWVTSIASSNGIGYNWRPNNNNYWTYLPVELGDGYEGHAGPSIAYLKDDEGMAAELVAFAGLSSGTPPPPDGIGLAHRDWTDDDPEDWEYSYFAPDYLDGPRRPNVYGSGDTFYMVFTANVGGARNVLYTYSTNHGANWEDPYTLYATGCDSASIVVFGDRAYAQFSRVTDVAPYHHAYAKWGWVWSYNGTPATPPSDVTAGPQGERRLARVPGSDALHRVTVFDDFVNYERSDDNGVSWEYQNAPDFGTNPTLALYNGNPLICYLRSCSVFCARLNSDSEWTIKTIFAGTSMYKPGVPSLAVFPNAGAGTRMANACFPVYDNTGSGSLILLAQFDTAASGGVVLDTIDSNANSKADSAVTVAVGLNDTIEVCFEHGDSIYYKYLQYSPSTYDRPGDWTKYTLVNAGGTNAQHPQAEKVGDRFYVTFSEHWSPGAQTVWAIKRTSCCDTATAVTWEGTVSVSNEDAALKDFPSMSTGMVVAWAESSSTTTHWVIETRCGDSLLTLTDPDTNCKFVSICADTAVQTSPSTSTTGIYYLWLQQYSGDTWQVPYASKQVLTSDADANVTMYNQGRKLALDDNDTLHAVYRTDQGSLYYGKKKDGVEGWTSSLLRSTGDMPAVDCDYLNRVWVADRDHQESDVIRCQTRAAGTGAWTDFQVYSYQLFEETETPFIGPPAIVACLNDTDGQNRSAAYIVFAVYEPGMMTARSTICMAKVNTSGVVYVDTLRSVMNHDDSFPSISLHPVAGEGYAIHVSWQEGTEVYVKKTLDQDQPQYTTKRTWSSNYNLSNSAANSRHPQIVAADTVLVAWVEGDSGAIYVKGQGTGSDYNVWDASVNASACPDTVCDYPSIALGDSNIVTYQKKLSASNYDVIARVNFHSNLNLSNSTTNSKYPHCVFHLHKDSFPVISTVWTEELSTNYAEVAYKRWQLGEADGGGIQNAGFLDPNIHPCLFAPSPNPFNGLTNIRYQTNITGLTRVSIMDVAGRRVRNVLTMPQNPGIYNLTWNARDDRERQLPRGVYFVRLETENYHEARKLILTE